MALAGFTTLTFDCYGTLIDWETGIWQALQPWREATGLSLSRDRLLETFGRHEAAQQAATPAMNYRDVLAASLRRIGAEFGVPVSEEVAARFGRSVGDWPAFDDSPEALGYLKQHYRLVVLSNVDRASFALSGKRLGVDFDAVYTAEDIGSYKPDPRNFAYMIERLAEQGIDRGEVLHVAQSLRHDHVPAEDAGLATCWIDRRHDREGFGATSPPPRQPRIDFRFPSLAAMVEAHRRETAG